MSRPAHMGPMTSLAQPGFGIYVHWPFCAAKCPYCDFNSHVRHRSVDQAAYARAMAREIEWTAERSRGERVTSVFFGGGTPSLMEADTVAHVLDAIRGSWDVDPAAEITLEANPTSVEAERFRAYRTTGVNRVSLGVQSLDDRQLKFLGRLHSADEARRAIALARDTFERMSFDLIYARPGQTVAMWERELEEAIALAADHLSLYQLTVEPGTPFHGLAERGRLVVPDPDRAADLYEATQAIAGARGMPAYEVSNHARPGDESRHNLIYWRYGLYAGIGPGAHGRLQSDGVRLATRTHARPETWLAAVERDGHGMAETQSLSSAEAGDEMLVMGLRLREGIDPARYERLSGRPLDPAKLAELAGDGLIEHLSGGHVRASPRGFLVLNALIGELAA